MGDIVIPIRRIKGTIVLENTAVLASFLCL